MTLEHTRAATCARVRWADPIWAAWRQLPYWFYLHLQTRCVRLLAKWAVVGGSRSTEPCRELLPPPPVAEHWNPAGPEHPTPVGDKPSQSHKPG